MSVTRRAAGRGVGTALITHAEELARASGVAMLTLNIFIENRRARELYARLAFREEWIRCVKRL
jgi:ribosomal protein S18 acetylase RimI-like enzyme